MGTDIRCYYCGSVVSRESHREHVELFEVLLESDVPGVDNTFVHMRSPGKSKSSGREKQPPPYDRFDEDGTAVVCDRCFVHEVWEGVT